MVKLVEKEEIAAKLAKEEEVIVMTEEPQQVQLSPLFFLLLLVNKYSTILTCKPGQSPLPTVWESLHPTLLTMV